MRKGFIRRISTFAWCLAIITTAVPVAGLSKPARPFVFALRGKPIQSLSPLDAFTTNQMTVEAQIMEGLMRFDPKKPDQTPLRNLAFEHFEIDPRTFVFRLRKDAFFHPFPGHPKDLLTAIDVKFSLERAKRSRSPMAASLQEVASIDTVGKDLVKIKLRRPNRNFLAILATAIGHVTSKNYYESLGKDDATRSRLFNQKPIGTGPYLLRQPLTGAKSITLERFEGYRDANWARSPEAIARVTFQFYEDPKAILKGIENDDVAMANLPLTEYGDGVKVSTGKGSLTLLTPPFLVILAINTTKPLLNDVKIRQILNAAVRTPKVLGICRSDPQDLPTGFQYYMRIPQHYLLENGVDELKRLRADPATKLRLDALRRAGPFTILAPDRPDHVVDEILEAVAADLRAHLGLEVRIRRVRVVIRDIVEKEQPDLAYVEWTPDTAWEQADLSILRPLFGAGSEYNIGGYRDPQVERLFDNIRGINDPATNEKIYDDIQKRLLAQAPLIWLPSVRHWTLFLKTGYEASYAGPASGGTASVLVHFTSMIRDIRMMP